MRITIIIYIICIYISLSPASAWNVSPQDIAASFRAGKTAWDIFNGIFFGDSPNEPATILLRYHYTTSKGKSKSRSKYISFPNKVDNPISDGPFETLEETAQSLSRKKRNEFDISDECEFIYYDGDKKVAINIMDDGDLIILMSKEGDRDGNGRLVDIICDDDEPQINEDYAKQNLEQSLEIQHALYHKNNKAFNHVIAIQNENTEIETKNADIALNKAGFGGFSIDCKGIAILDIEKNSFKTQTDQLATEWQWDGKITSTLDMVTISGRQFSGGLNIEFDAAAWKIKGNYARFAGFKTVEDKYSIYVATAKFEYTIPRAERDGNVLDTLGIASGGSIKQEYFEKIKILLEGKSLERFAIDVVKPQPDDYRIYEHSNKNDL